MMWMKWAASYISPSLLIYLFGAFLGQPVLAHTYSINIQDKKSLHRGAMLYMNYCSGCHSLKYLRYSRIAEELGLTRFDGHIDKVSLKNNLIFTQGAIDDPIRIALPPEDAKQWFGVIPPDLSLITRQRSTAWIYSYLSGFYRDDSRPFGTNNYLIPEVAMPNILETLRDELSDSQFDTDLHDLLTFLAYVGQPEQSLRYRLGLFVIGFLFVFFLAALGLKKVYWRKIGIK